MEPITGTTYLVMFFVVVVIRRRETKAPDETWRHYEELKDTVYASALLAEGLLTVLATLLTGRM